MLRLFYRLVRRLMISTFILAVCWLLGLVWFMLQVPRVPAKDVMVTDAIVVLTGGSGRIDYGLQLLKAGKGSKLFISGVETSVKADSLIKRHQPSMVGMVRDAEGAGAVIMLGYSARNTIGNAMETAQWVRREGLKSLRLVTANYHMPRALEEFTSTMPRILIIPDPVMPEDFDVNRWWTLDASSQLLISEYHKFVAAKLRHWLILAVEDNA